MLYQQVGDPCIRGNIFQPQMHEWVRPVIASILSIGWICFVVKRLKSGALGWLHPCIRGNIFQPQMHEWVRPGMVSFLSIGWICFEEKRLKSGARGCLHSCICGNIFQPQMHEWVRPGLLVSAVNTLTASPPSACALLFRG